jgi:hypothetical protein
MNSHLHAELMQSHLAEIEQSAERYRREGDLPARRRRFTRNAGSFRPQLSLRPRPNARPAAS